MKTLTQYVNEGLHEVTKSDITNLVKRIGKYPEISVSYKGKNEDGKFVFVMNGETCECDTKKEAYDTMKEMANKIRKGE